MKTCGHCGAFPAHLKMRKEKCFFVVACVRCGARGPEGSSEENAIALWDERLGESLLELSLTEVRQELRKATTWQKSSPTNRPRGDRYNIIIHVADVDLFFELPAAPTQYSPGFSKSN